MIEATTRVTVSGVIRPPFTHGDLGVHVADLSVHVPPIPVFTSPIRAFTSPISAFTSPISAFTSRRSRCSRPADPGVHEAARSALGRQRLWAARRWNHHRQQAPGHRQRID
jgi:hypothetical protein